MYFVGFDNNSFSSKTTLSTKWAKTTKARTKHRSIEKKIKRRKSQQSSNDALNLSLGDKKRCAWALTAHELFFSIDRVYQTLLRETTGQHGGKSLKT